MLQAGPAKVDDSVNIDLSAMADVAVSTNHRVASAGLRCR